MIARFFRGMGYFGRGWRVAFGQARLVPFVLLPAAITVAIAVVGALAAYHWEHDWIARHGVGQGFLWDALVWLSLLLALAAAYVFYVASCLVATALFAGVLSERAEAVERGQAPEPQPWRQIVALSLRGLGQAILGILLYLLIAVLLFVLHWVVPVTAPLLWIAGLAQTALFFAFDAFYEPLHRRGASFGGKWRFIFSHLAESLGFGAGVALLMMVPLFSVIVVPVAIVGGTLLYLELARPSR